MKNFHSFIGQHKIPIKVEYTIHKNTTNFTLTYLEDLVLTKKEMYSNYIWVRTSDDLPYDIFFMGDLAKEYPSVISKKGDLVTFSIKLDKRIHRKTKQNPNGIFYMGGCGIQIK